MVNWLPEIFENGFIKWEGRYVSEERYTLKYSKPSQEKKGE